MSKTCKVDGCQKAAFGRGFCSMHYYRVIRNGSLSARRKARHGAPEAWVRENSAHQGDDCLFWPFGSPRNGYGQVRISGVDMSASRFMCIVAHGAPSPENLHAAHSCGHGHLGCVNPKHLRWATASENALDLQIHKHVRGPAAVGAVS